MDDQNKNLILATVLSFLVILGWFVAGPMLFPQWFPEETAATTEVAAPDATTMPAAEDAAPAAAAAGPPGRHNRHRHHRGRTHRRTLAKKAR